MISQGINIELDPTPPQSICDQPDSDPEAPSDEDEDMDNATMEDEGFIAIELYEDASTGLC